VAACASDCGVCTECRAACDAQHSVYTPHPAKNVATTLQKL